MRKLIALAAVLSAATALAGDAARTLAWKPLADARAGQRARYEGKVADSAGKVMDTYEVTVEVARAEAGDDEVAVAVAYRGGAPKEHALTREADARQVIEALRLVPRGAPLDGLKAVPAKARVEGKDVEATKVTLEGAVAGGPGGGSFSFEAVFAREAGPLGLVSSRTAVHGGGAGISTLERKD